MGTGREAQALTIVLDFVSSPTTDLFGIGTDTASYSPFHFSAGLTSSQIQQSLLSTVTADYLSYPTATQNPLSPLANGKQLNIDFAMSTGLAAPSNGDAEYFFVAIGANTTSNNFLGQACYTCVRQANGAGPGVASGNIVGSILVNQIAGIAGNATTDAERIYLIGETIAHEIGHTLALDHPTGATANPGASIYDIMATGVAPSSMPNNQRILDRAFSYVEFGTLISAIGLRDASAVPEPDMLALFSLGALLLAVTRMRTRRMDFERGRFR